ncbi:hypothetical protein K4K56_003586 [Colletotrichum sp. SAR 10_98]|nr:hypothetical protein K4K56_003586 [Colletotrichum sp. SAR 10_98]
MPRQNRYSEEETDERRTSDEKGNESISSATTLLLNETEFVRWKQRRDSSRSVEYLDAAERHRHREIGYPLRWTKWDKNDQFYISTETFDSWENIQESAARLRAVHNDVFIHSNGQKATYLAYDGVRKELPPEAGQFGLELYGIQAFHQIHCVYVLLESVGWARHNRPSQWDGDHIAHCLNTMTQAATCLADSRPFAYVVPGGHRTDGQQNWCRDFGALVDWVNDPVRDHNFHYELDSNDTDHFMPIYRNGSIAGKPVDKSVWPGAGVPRYSSLSSAEIVRQATWMQTALTAMVALVSLPTSRVADSPRVGRKGVLLMSMAVLGTSTLCFGFIRSFAQAMVLRIVEGTFSGGTLVVRTMIPEIVPGKRHRVKAFLLLPLAFNIGALAGPPLAGLLVAYAQSHAATNDFLGRWTDQPDIGIRIKKAVVRLWRRYRSRGEFKFGYEPANTRDSEDTQDSDPLLSPQADAEAQSSKREPTPALVGRKLPLRKALTANVLLATSCQAMLDGLTAGYNTLWPLFLSDPPASAVVKGEENSSSPLRFSGGAGLQPYQIALTLTILAVTALPLQIWVYPRVSYKLKPIGTLRCFLWCPALAFALSPLIAVTVKFPILMWLVIAVVQLLMVLTSAMVVPSATLMTNKLSLIPAFRSTCLLLEHMLIGLVTQFCPKPGRPGRNPRLGYDAVCSGANDRPIRSRLRLRSQSGQS